MQNESPKKHRPGLVNGDGLGTGKTITSIAIAGALAQAGKVQRVLIVAPLSILGVWQDEFAKFAAFDYTLQVLTGSSTQKAKTLRGLNGSGLQVAVVNYESAWRLEKELAAWQPDLIICDEGHKIKSHGTNASKTMHRLGARAKYRLLLTGTPVTNKAVDIFSQYKFLHPAVFGTSFYRFRNRYFEQGYFPSQLTMKQHMEPEFTQRLHSIAFRATKADCLDLPDTLDIVRSVELEPAARRTYHDLVRDSFAELGVEDTVTAANILTRLMRLSQLTGGFIKPDDGKVVQISRAKLAALEDIIEQAVAEGKKLVVIARFVAEIEAICAMLTNMGIAHSCIMGGVTDRDEQVVSFQTDPTVQVFVGQIATAGMGITLTAASTMVFYSLDYSMSNFEQAKARIHRVGQRDKCTYVYLVARGTVDEKILQALRDKADLAKTLIDDFRTGGNPYAE
ncbi:MAG: DEAD/DEAH box helicase [Oscillospiraceae bacterium]|nr:DEAD/DEAH box helicase [Oscillospiraceae bacterium]